MRRSRDTVAVGRTRPQPSSRPARPYAHKRTRTIARIILIVVVAVTPGLGLVSPASAATCTFGVLCGKVVNHTTGWTMIAGGSVDVQRGWCWNDNAPRYVHGSFGCQTARMLPAHTASDTGSYFNGGHMKDVDSFRVDAGCVVKYTDPALNPALIYPYHTRVEDRRGKVQDKWIKLGNSDTIDISYQSCGGRPAKYYVNTWATAHGYQDQHCLYDQKDSTDHARCNSDGVLYSARNYFFCKIWGDRVGSANAYNRYWLLTDLDVTRAGRDGRSFVSAYFLTGGPTDSQNDSAYYFNGSTWQWIPNC